ncbi:MAG: SMP-30/gluconolactonase/LRE family protein [Spirochaetes bacterium]|nr:SMP-30/gluconolactonase/LRE family protein [Spirochaetota bacterium]
MENAELAWRADASLGEGPLWDTRESVLLWLDIFGRRIHRFDPASGAQTEVESADQVACIGFAGENKLIAGTDKGIQFFDPRDGTLEPICNPEPTEITNRFNDGKIDPWGRFIAGTMSTVGKTGRGALFCIGHDFQVTKLLEGLSISNGLDWSPDGKTFYLIDSAVKCVFAFDYREGPRLANKRIVIDASEEAETKLLDGMCVDQEGMLWVCHFGSGRLVRWDPARGRRLETVEVPAPKVTSCAFGGANMKTLFITSARTGLDGKTLSTWPLSGSLFKVDGPVGGFPPGSFGINPHAANGKMTSQQGNHNDR